MRGGGSPIPKSICQNSYQKVNILMKTKNAPKDLKCKINHTFFFGNRGFQKGGRWGRGPTLGKNSQKITFFFWERPKEIFAVRDLMSLKFLTLNNMSGPFVRFKCIYST